MTTIANYVRNIKVFFNYLFEIERELAKKIHNGQKGDSQWLIAGWELLSTQRIFDEWNVWKELSDKGTFNEWDVESQEGITNVWWQQSWIPLTYNGCGDHHCLDLAPTAKGTEGQIISMWHDSAEREVLAASYKQWFEYLVCNFEGNDAEFVFDSGDFDFKATK
ncbi:SMI1/KNR4 family protein [Paenibacillus alginolyticus]|uniref:SMI1/KNR4 family protein n=1 Tax=Paenibacillus alginolyticus TaxID=59839 RepID=A0ABT4GKC2_9BACL|nr:SMI1/KNR4 family protein [Paenibacillus alginolyticus]MCY9668234.1 SMI1/KNR4 family protein [Paenibacillus alginolyticus]MCY9696561.1 SMI1/KNR4 family protein [Paenibacillus alginolyticus]MEC0148650.1 SMI1/KNR4 family protein [Paenibacillus alginolyticus]